MTVENNKYTYKYLPSVNVSSPSINEVVEGLNNPTVLNEWVAFSNNLEELNKSVRENRFLRFVQRMY
jgi:hypothetical protein